MAIRQGIFGASLVAALGGCERGCARSWFEERGVGTPGSAPRGGGAVQAIDCPDGLARCSDGVVEVSRLATIPAPCVGRPEGCTCPWERAGDCLDRCVADGATLVVDRQRAVAQLCAPVVATSGDAGLATPASSPADCEDDVRYRCSAGDVVSCADHAVIAHCVRGCASEGSDIGVEIDVGREGAFAILCTR
jgi:hypothetical protein